MHRVPEAGNQDENLTAFCLICLPAWPQTELQSALVKASMEDVHELDGECAELRAAVAKRDRLVRDMGELSHGLTHL